MREAMYRLQTAATAAGMTTVDAINSAADELERKEE